MKLTDGFTRDINLPGWAEQSIWGYDPLLECYWAALWRDDDCTDSPRIEFSVYHLIPTMALLSQLLAAELDLPDVDVARALSA